MGRRRDSHDSVIPDDIAEVIVAADIDTIFDYLEHEFHFSKVWRNEFRIDLKLQAGRTPETEFFVRYLLRYIQPLIQDVTKRGDDVIFAMLRYLLKERLEEKRRKKQEIRNYYKNGNWKGKA